VSPTSTYAAIPRTDSRICDYYLPPSSASVNRTSAMANAIILIHNAKPGRRKGNTILTFSSGRAEVRAVETTINNYEGLLCHNPINTIRALGEIDGDTVDSSTRRVVLVTNAVETSITIPGARRWLRHHPNTSKRSHTSPEWYTQFPRAPGSHGFHCPHFNHPDLRACAFPTSGVRKRKFTQFKNVFFLKLGHPSNTREFRTT
jgi:hypothetical protein